MKLLITLSLRNLFRQKRRNILLGIAIALGVTILVLANSFSQGISDIMFNKIMRWVTGQVTVRFNEKGRMNREIFRDKERVMALIKNTPGVLEADEGAGMFCRAIGNGKSDNIIIVGVNTSLEITEETKKELEDSFRLIEGGWKDLENPAINNPVIVSEEKARFLNVKKGDVIRVRFRNMFGQDQAARLTVSGIMKNDNIFMQPVVFLELRNAKLIFGYKPYETASLTLKVKDAVKNSAAIADSIHAKLKPGVAVIHALTARGDKSSVADVLGYRSDEESKKKLSALLKIKSGSVEAALKKDGVVIFNTLAGALKVKAGDEIKIGFARKFEETPAEKYLKVSAVAADNPELKGNVILVNDEKFYDIYYENLPKPAPEAFIPDKDGSWAGLVSPEWILLERTANTEEAKKKYIALGKKKWKGTTIDVSTMYETASDIMKLEGVLKLITLSAVMVLFFIILLGVVNTLRMTIRERTREIGTIRAIGMQKNDVRHIFILETFFLTLFASIAGIAAAYISMWLLSQITFKMSDNPMGMLLVNGHLYFLPTFTGIAGNVALIILIAVVTAYFPSRRAANLSPAKALGHFE
ncbi:MAG TPA: hypothetical protein DEE98_02610 [Elusimicrobia bacterium]|nr:MAG: hypothetical protein A2278_07440 [Elusimicrobia bacterium RIFOXYA12_FULL_49_49]OGS09761.1 MAG: hypothetical protein A2386_03830 [Elusimicrobia bacterium RIFOXYB1_FULL_48_9]OGS10146.1 MAG: hypothetical protein A2204_03805 [Elusimicrobia bacterium RIFOXYA1_FULL_47_7]OGS16101.1 MAG: hypothetical protein A2251_02825 [Elusimicrobia bacterium RIFOXYA2_FULL_47_53]OGS26727.1 MAG: hypothetical protein A2339_03875 [Elusimicrobia bacterium RIFOXYB12_FULL_50_12]OGS30147.1 MAG: hypothetical protein